MVSSGEERSPVPGDSPAAQGGAPWGAWARLWQWARRPGAGSDLAAAALALAVLVTLYFVLTGGPRGGPLASALPPGTAARLWALPEKTAIPARLELAGTASDERPARKEGAAVGLWFQVEAPSRPLVLERQAELRTVQLTDPDGGPYVVRDPPGPRRVHLIVFPPDVDPLTLPAAELARLAPRVTVIERRYEAAFREASDVDE
jgi:hypothetical protein